jgi:hypothetical protein
METQDVTDRIDSEWENRKLCRDGNCIGVIGVDGRCKECGLPYDGELPLKTGPITNAGNEPDTNPESVPQTEPESPLEEDWENRVLCRDGNCIGVIGPDGLCKVCGRPYDK